MYDKFLKILTNQINLSISFARSVPFNMTISSLDRRNMSNLLAGAEFHDFSISIF